MKFEIKNKFSGAVMFVAEIECDENAATSVKIGLAVRWAVKSRADLSGADLRGADLRGADLSRSDLSRSDLSRADLSCADLSCADLSCANLHRSDLSRSDLSRADLRGADLSCADLRSADLSRSDLSRSDLSRADLSCADLRSADLRGAKGAELAIERTRILADGDLIGWKKCANNVIVKLRIPADAKRSHAFGRKCRAEYVDVLEVHGAEFGISKHDGKIEYRVGQRVMPDRFDDNWQNECAPGIHFFISKIEAEDY